MSFLTRRLAIAAVFMAGIVLVNANSALATSSDKQPTVVELFTSQGCSSCPPADALLRSLADQPGIICLTFHVDYWDYIGWKDPFASAESTNRQRAYAKAMKMSYVYTPQMVVDGNQHFVGSDQDKLHNGLVQAQSHKGDKLIMAKADQATVDISKSASKVETHDIWFVGFDLLNKTKITNGENAGRELAYANSVRELKHLGTWSGEAQRVSVPESQTEGAVLLVQKQGHGTIVGSILLK